MRESAPWQKVEQDAIVGSRLRLADDTAEQHRLAFPRIARDPEQSALLVIAPSLEVGVFEDLAV